MGMLKLAAFVTLQPPAECLMQAFTAWLGQHGGLFCSPPGFNPLLLEAERLLEAPRVDSDAAYWPTLQRLVLTGQLEVALQLLTAHPAYQALQDVDMAAKVKFIEGARMAASWLAKFIGTRNKSPSAV